MTNRQLTVNFVACLLLLVQFLLGMATNLFVTLPTHHPGANAQNYFAGMVAGLAWVIPHGAFWAAIHAVFGLALVVAAVIAVVLTWQTTRAAAMLSVLGALAVIGAAFNGTSFLNYGHDFSSMIMSALWAVALTCYATGMFLAARQPTQSTHEPSATMTPGR
jgi:hypothetical protein